MTRDELRAKANDLPLLPGVYLMMDKTGQVIYVGKAKKLKNRVSQYFQDTASHNEKTKMMVAHVDRFDTIIVRSEFEALVLENSLIKRHQPRYNILLKDDKGYPFVRLDSGDYPRFTLVNRTADDGAKYYGPFGGRHETRLALDAVCAALRLPTCSRRFPRDIGKERPCLNYHMNQCAGWCQENKSCTEYRETMLQARELLKGNYKAVAEQLRGQMLAAADNLEFELAASLRDRLNAVENLGQKQLVTAGTLADTDVVGYGETEAKACFAVLHFPAAICWTRTTKCFPDPTTSWKPFPACSSSSISAAASPLSGFCCPLRSTTASCSPSCWNSNTGGGRSSTSPSGATICVWWSWPAKMPLRKLSVSQAGKSGSARR